MGSTDSHKEKPNKSSALEHGTRFGAHVSDNADLRDKLHSETYDFLLAMQDSPPAPAPVIPTPEDTVLINLGRKIEANPAQVNKTISEFVESTYREVDKSLQAQGKAGTLSLAKDLSTLEQLEKDANRPLLTPEMRIASSIYKLTGSDQEAFVRELRKRVGVPSARLSSPDSKMLNQFIYDNLKDRFAPPVDERTYDVVARQLNVTPEEARLLHGRYIAAAQALKLLRPEEKPGALIAKAPGAAPAGEALPPPPEAHVPPPPLPRAGTASPGGVPAMRGKRIDASKIGALPIVPDARPAKTKESTKKEPSPVESGVVAKAESVKGEAATKSESVVVAKSESNRKEKIKEETKEEKEAKENRNKLLLTGGAGLLALGGAVATAYGIYRWRTGDSVQLRNFANRNVNVAISESDEVRPEAGAELLKHNMFQAAVDRCRVHKINIDQQSPEVPDSPEAQKTFKAELAKVYNAINYSLENHDTPKELLAKWQEIGRTAYEEATASIGGSQTIAQHLNEIGFVHTSLSRTVSTDFARGRADFADEPIVNIGDVGEPLNLPLPGEKPLPEPAARITERTPEPVTERRPETITTGEMQRQALAEIFETPHFVNAESIELALAIATQYDAQAAGNFLAYQTVDAAVKSYEAKYGRSVDAKPATVEDINHLREEYLKAHASMSSDLGEATDLPVGVKEQWLAAEDGISRNLIKSTSAEGFLKGIGYLKLTPLDTDCVRAIKAITESGDQNDAVSGAAKLKGAMLRIAIDNYYATDGKDAPISYNGKGESAASRLAFMKQVQIAQEAMNTLVDANPNLSADLQSEWHRQSNAVVSGLTREYKNRPLAEALFHLGDNDIQRYAVLPPQQAVLYLTIDEQRILIDLVADRLAGDESNFRSTDTTQHIDDLADMQGDLSDSDRALVERYIDYLRANDSTDMTPAELFQWAAGSSMTKEEAEKFEAARKEHSPFQIVLDEAYINPGPAKTVVPTVNNPSTATIEHAKTAEPAEEMHVDAPGIFEPSENPKLTAALNGVEESLQTIKASMIAMDAISQIGPATEEQTRALVEIFAGRLNQRQISYMSSIAPLSSDQRETLLSKAAHEVGQETANEEITQLQIITQLHNIAMGRVEETNNKLNSSVQVLQDFKQADSADTAIERATLDKADDRLRETVKLVEPATIEQCRAHRVDIWARLPMNIMSLTESDKPTVISCLRSYARIDASIADEQKGLFAKLANDYERETTHQSPGDFIIAHVGAPSKEQWDTIIKNPFLEEGAAKQLANKYQSHLSEDQKRILLGSQISEATPGARIGTAGVAAEVVPAAEPAILPAESDAATFHETAVKPELGTANAVPEVDLTQQTLDEIMAELSRDVQRLTPEDTRTITAEIPRQDKVMNISRAENAVLVAREYGPRAGALAVKQLLFERTIKACAEKGIDINAGPEAGAEHRQSFYEILATEGEEIESTLERFAKPSANPVMRRVVNEDGNLIEQDLDMKFLVRRLVKECGNVMLRDLAPIGENAKKYSIAKCLEIAGHQKDAPVYISRNQRETNAWYLDQHLRESAALRASLWSHTIDKYEYTQFANKKDYLLNLRADIIPLLSDKPEQQAAVIKFVDRYEKDSSQISPASFLLSEIDPIHKEREALLNAAIADELNSDENVGRIDQGQTREAAVQDLQQRMLKVIQQTKYNNPLVELELRTWVENELPKLVEPAVEAEIRARNQSTDPHKHTELRYENSIEIAGAIFTSLISEEYTVKVRRHNAEHETGRQLTNLGVSSLEEVNSAYDGTREAYSPGVLEALGQSDINSPATVSGTLAQHSSAPSERERQAVEVTAQHVDAMLEVIRKERVQAVRNNSKESDNLTKLILEVTQERRAAEQKDQSGEAVDYAKLAAKIESTRPGLLERVKSNGGKLASAGGALVLFGTVLGFAQKSQAASGSSKAKITKAAPVIGKDR